MTRPLTRRGVTVSAAAFAAVVTITAVAGCSSSASSSSTASSSDSASTSSVSQALVPVRIPDPGNAGSARRRARRTAAWPRRSRRSGPRWSGPAAAGPFAPAALEMAANELDYRAGLDHLGGHLAGRHPGVQALRRAAPDRIGEGVLVPASSPDQVACKDLIGKTVAVNKGGTGEYLLRKALAAAESPPRRSPSSTSRRPRPRRCSTRARSTRGRPGTQYSVAEVGLDNARFVATGAQIGSQNYSVWAVRTGFAQKYPKIVAAFYNYLHTEGLKLVSDPAEFINVFTTAGPEALNPAEVAFDAKDSAALGTTEPISPTVATAVPERGQLLLVSRGDEDRGQCRAVRHPAGERRMTADTGVDVLPGPGHAAASAREAAAGRGVGRAPGRRPGRVLVGAGGRRAPAGR